MIQRQQSMTLSPYMALYDILILEDNELRQINDLIDFSFVLEELEDKYCIDNGRNAIDPIRMFKYLLLKSIVDVSIITSAIITSGEKGDGAQLQGLKRIMKLMG